MKMGKYSRLSILVTAGIGSLLMLSSVFAIRLEMVLRAEGRIMPFQEFPLFAPENAIIRKVAVEQGQICRQGDVLFELYSEGLHEDATKRRLEWIEASREWLLLEADLEAWTIRPGSPELLTAERRRDIEERILRIQQDLMDMYVQIREKQVISQLDVSLREIEKLRAELELEQSRQYAQWQAAGLGEVERRRLEQARDMASQRMQALEDAMVHLDQRMTHLIVQSPVDGLVATLDHRYAGAYLQAGERLGVIAHVQAGYIARVYAPPRNIDLLRPGRPVKLTSGVFESILEGYIEGTVLRVAPDALSPTDARYEVDVEIHHSPYPLVLGSPVQAKIMVGKRSLMQTFFRTAGSGRSMQAEGEP